MTAEDRLCAAHSGLVQSSRQHETQIGELWLAVKSVQNRPPVWATALMSFLTFVIGILVGVIGMGMK
jgi:hypothetical protein